MADEVILNTNIPNEWPDAPEKDTVKLVFVVPAGQGKVLCETYFPQARVETKRPKEYVDNFIQGYG